MARIMRTIGFVVPDMEPYEDVSLEVPMRPHIPGYAFPQDPPREDPNYRPDVELVPDHDPNIPDFKNPYAPKPDPNIPDEHDFHLTEVPEIEGGTVSAQEIPDDDQEMPEFGSQSGPFMLGFEVYVKTGAGYIVTGKLRIDKRGFYVRSFTELSENEIPSLFEYYICETDTVIRSVIVGDNVYSAILKLPRLYKGNMEEKT
jgi:hypothetical protein